MNETSRRRVLRRARYATAGLVLAATTGTAAFTVVAAADTLADNDAGVATPGSSATTTQSRGLVRPDGAKGDVPGLLSVLPGTSSHAGSNAS